MITLLLKEITRLLQSHPDYRREVDRLAAGTGAGTGTLTLAGVQSGFLPFVIRDLHDWLAGQFLVVVPSEKEAESLSEDLQTGEGVASVVLQTWEVLPYSGVRPRASILGARARALGRILAGEELVVVASLRVFASYLTDPGRMSGTATQVQVDEVVDVQELERTLSGYGYLRVPRVGVHGEIAVRGEVVDIFPPGGNDDGALRIVLDFDRVSEIRVFDPGTQMSSQRRESLTLYPCREGFLSEDLEQPLRDLLLSLHDDPSLVDGYVETARADPDLPGLETLLPLCQGRKFSLADYFAGDAVLLMVDSERMAAGHAALVKETTELYRASRVKRSFAPHPEMVVADPEEIARGFRRQVYFAGLGEAEAPAVRLSSEPPRSFFGNVRFFREEMENLSGLGYRIFVFAVYEYQAERIRSILPDMDVEILPYSNSSGFSVPDGKLMVVHENEIFGRKRRIPRSVGRAKSRPIDSFVELSPGDYVVHVNYGIGRFVGIERITAMGNERDYIQLAYADEETVFLPVEQVNLIQRYIGGEGKGPRLDTLGSKSWQRRKEKVKRSVEQLAERLLALYSRRHQGRGHAFGPDTQWQNEFEAAFPYQETLDQLRCIEDVKADMERPAPMDRLVCGDVGYGKTEIALRAAFKAVMDGKQVALLAPTTILVEQHYETFVERFAQYPVNIEMLSRFRTRGEQRMTLAGLAEGRVDIVIGTHRALQRDVLFKNVGLLVVDEEQRFGVKDKERLKELKTNVDCLTLTATPIPRTLHMSLMKIRDMSILETPPQNRQPIETFIQEFDPDLVAMAIRSEVERGGQVYYLHNRVRTMLETRAFLQKLVPEVSIEVGHGQMDSEELEDIMHRFIRNETHVLLSTSIIENGLDIPNVNTIIIDRADMFGVSQLYQLRGRVGRSDELAYAYLFYPDKRAINELAMKRLRIISDFTELGSGFKIALKDLEMRGAGNLLGREQSGEILAVGFDLYIRLLDEAIRSLGDEETEETEVYLELEYTGYIPDTYISEPLEKMEVYKLVASIATQDEFEAVHRELLDRFGPIPDEVLSVLSLAEIRVMCRGLHIASLRERNGVATAEFSRLSHLSVDKALRLIRESGDTVFLDPSQPNCICIRTGAIRLKDKSEFIYDKLSRLL